jgi:signal peptidase I
VKHAIFINPDVPAFDFSVRVPKDHYFMMGDNRDNSTDSRVPPEQGGVGYVPFENFVGRAEVIFFSLDEGVDGWQVWKWPTAIRWSRLFQPVR